MLQSTNKKSAALYFHLAVGLFFMFVFGRVFAPVYPLTEVGMQVIGVFIGVIWFWCFVGFLWPSLLAFVAFGLTDFGTFGQILTMSFGNSVPVLLLFSMILFGSPQHVGATRYITRFFLTRKVFNNRPIVFAFVFIFATYALSVFVNVTPALILMWTVLYGILNELGYKKGEKFSSLMLVGTFLGAISGQASLPFSGSTLAIIGVFETAAEMQMPILPYMTLGFIFSVLVFIVYAIFMKIVLKKEELQKVAHVNTEMFERDPLPPMSRLQKANFLGMLAFVFFMILPSILNAIGSLIGLFAAETFVVLRAFDAIIGVLETLGAAGVAIGLTGIMCLIHIEKKPVLDFKAVAASSVNWDIFVMVAVAVAIASALTNPQTGVVAMMVEYLQPVLGGHTPIIFFIIMVLFAIFVTSFASAMVIGIAIMPVLVAFGIETGANLPAVAATTILLLHYSIILPSASVFAAMLWSNDEWITGKEVFKYGAFIVIAATIIAIAAIMPISLLLF